MYLVRDVFLTLQSGQKVPKMVPSPLVLFLSCCCWCVFLFYGCYSLGKITMVSPHSQENLVLEENVFSSGFWGFLGGGGAWTKTLLKFQTLLFYCSLTGRAESQQWLQGKFRQLQQLIALIARWVGRIASMLRMKDGDLHTAEQKMPLLL